MLCWLRSVIWLYWFALTYLLLAQDPLWFLSGTEGVDDSSALLFLDLIHHSLAFGVLGGLLTSELQRGKLISWTLGLAVTYSIGTEFVQLVVPGRFASVLDTLANISGLIIGWGTVQIWRSLVPSCRVRTSSVISS